ncbi:FecR domain-containing protein [Mangrovibacterium marinum]|uniref:FecR family protein n=1 Tax=Mangrovibacterium marinum TaxID=1639118 RepID=UPI002A18D848|nr:FecR domain-containing protein [Mangrovibacterium marinum]
MRDDRENIHAEDLLSDDLLLQKLKERKPGFADKAGREELLAVDILDVLAERRTKITNKERSELEARIQASIRKQQFSRILTWSAVAAMFVVFLGITWFFNTSNSSGIRQFAESIQVDQITNTKLFLTQGESYEIGAQSSEIAYLSDGQEVEVSSEGKSVVLPNSDLRVQQSDSEGNYNMIVVPYGRRSRVLLPDSSVVWLNSGSKLTYPGHFEKNKREVVLEGEAMFEVSHDKERPFTVLTRDLDVRVLGTVFCVTAYDDEDVASTVLVKGAVELSYDSAIPGFKRKQIMVPGTKADLQAEDHQLNQYEVDPQEYTSWKDGYLSLKNATLESIGKRLSRYYNVPVKFENDGLKSERFSGYLDLKGSAKEVIEIITEITGKEVLEDNGTLLIREKQNPL